MSPAILNNTMTSPRDALRLAASAALAERLGGRSFRYGKKTGAELSTARGSSRSGKDRSSKPSVSFRLFRRACAIATLAVIASLSAFAQEPALAPADSARYLDNIKTLTAPKMEGRGDDTPGIALAADFIQQQYKSLGLEPAGAKGFLQPFNVVTGAKLAGKNEVAAELNGKKQELKLNEDFVPLSFSSTGQASATVVFVGYGATADEFHYDDFAGVDVKDKIVVLLRYEPSGFVAKGGNQGLTRHAALVTKAINARNHGAKAVIIVNGKMDAGEQDLLTRFGSVSGPENVGILLVQVKNGDAQAWFAAAGKSLADVQNQINTSNKPASFAFPGSLRLSVDVNIETLHSTVNNVLAYLPGKSDEYVILGAHYDHLGYGHYDSMAPALVGQIHPGADDNASGTSGVLELARLLAPMKGQLPRGILFCNFAGEELGLLGSAEWVKEPTRPLDKAVAMINMDMIGRIKDEKLYIGGVGTGSSFEATLTKDEKGFPFHIENSFGGYAASDHTSFVARKIPVLFFFSGLHGDYHRPSDTWEKINAKDAAKLLNMVGKVALDIDEQKKRPDFITVVEHDNPHSGVASSSGGGYGPYFGSIPDFGQSENGVRFSDVQPNSPAAKAGLKSGDVLIKFGGKKITNLYDFTDALRASKIGDVVQVTVTRNGKEITVPVTLAQRR